VDILLDPHNLSVQQNVPFLDLPEMANGNGSGAVFGVKTSNGGLKVKLN